MSSVILKSLDKKTRESTSLPPIRLPETHKALATQATALEARHLVAAFALFRVCSMKNMQVMLPPAYRKYWTDEFQAIKQADLQSRNESLYAADPFQARKERAILAEPPRAYKQAVSASCHGIGLDTGGQLGKPRAWSDVPSVDLGKKMRFQIQDILRRYATWNRFGSTIACAQRETIIKDLLRQGFRQSHIEEAVSECGDQEEARAFLLTYLPEDDLPLARLVDSSVSLFIRMSVGEQTHIHNAFPVPQTSLIPFLRRSRGRLADHALQLAQELCGWRKPCQLQSCTGKIPETALCRWLQCRDV